MSATAGDERFRSIFDANRADIQRFCYRRLLDPDDADDAAADVFVVLWRRLDDCPSGEEARLWLFGVARNVVRDHQRRRRRASRLRSQLVDTVQPVAADPPAATAVRHDEEQQVDAALARLPERDREVLYLKLWEQLSHSEIGQVLGISAHAVDMRVHRALGRLAALLGEWQVFGIRASPTPMRGVDHG